MDKVQEFKCNQCLEAFSFNKIPLKMPSCIHNVCRKCFAEVQESKLDVLQCGFCGNTMLQCKTRKLEVNKAIKEKVILETKTSEVSYPEYDSPSRIKPSFSAFEESDVLLIGEDYTTKKRSSSSFLQRKVGMQICSLHEKPLEIICLTDLKRICPHCAIFGNHRDHKFKSLKEFDEDFNKNLKQIQMIKQKKYVKHTLPQKIDKKINLWEQNNTFKKKLKVRKEELEKQVQKKFQTLIKSIREFKDKVIEELASSFLMVDQKIEEMVNEEDKVEGQFESWSSECENLLNKINQNIPLNEKIAIMYGPLLKIKEGENLINQMDKKAEVLTQKIDEKISTVRVDLSKNINLSNIAKVYFSAEEAKKQNFISMIEKVNSPIGKHMIDEVGDFSDNSFICDYSREDLSIFIEDSEPKTPMKKDKKAQLNQTLKFTSPEPKTTRSKIMRSKSNHNFKLSSLEQTGSKKNLQTKLNTTTEQRNPETVISDFLKQDLREVLDLSNCNLNDEKAYQYVKQVRRHRRIRGLKLNRNGLTDQGFQSMVDMFVSTSNLNLNLNELTEECLNIILRNKEKFSSLRMINISQNKINEKRARLKMEELKKLGITVTL